MRFSFLLLRSTESGTCLYTCKNLCELNFLLKMKYPKVFAAIKKHLK